jgi:hypothetical protein
MTIIKDVNSLAGARRPSIHEGEVRDQLDCVVISSSAL